MKLTTKLGDKPLWSQLYDIINSKIENGEVLPGDVLPPEAELMKKYGISRITVRQAMDKLLAEDKICRKRGKGTIVLEKTNPLETIINTTFKEVSELKGDVDMIVSNVSIKDITTEGASFFGVASDTKCLCIERVSKVNNQLVSVHKSYINPLVHADFKRDYEDSLYKMYAKLNYPITSVEETVYGYISDEEDKKDFNLDKDEVIIRRTRRGFSNEKPVEFTVAKFISSKYKLVIKSSVK